jgi:DNA-binding response OmpR family regulator
VSPLGFDVVISAAPAGGHRSEYVSGDIGPIEQREAASPPPRAERILVVEDDPEVRRYLVELLDEEGYQVDQAANGSEAMQQATSHKHALLVLDLMLPDTNGRELVQQLKQAGHELPTVVVTGGRTRENTEGIGAVAYLSKPFGLVSFMNAVELGLSSGRSE